MAKKAMILVILALIFALVSCSPRITSLAPEPEPVEKPVLLLEKLPWEREWEDLVKAAKKEGKVSIRSARGETVRQRLIEAFKNKFGIDLEIELGKSAQHIPKTLAERSAGLFLVDIQEGGPTDMLQILKPKGVLEPLDGIIFLPEVLDEKLWQGHYGPFFDKDHMVVGSSGTLSAMVLIDTRVVNPDEIKSYNDLLNAKWSGKMAMGDPTVSGGQQSAAVVMMLAMGEDFLKKLAEQQKPVFTRDRLQIVDWVARGKYPIAVGVTGEQIEQYRQAGATFLKPVTPIEGGKTSGAGVLVLIKNASHPNAARLFINWILTREGQTVFMQAASWASRRVDVSNDWVAPEYRIRPGIRYIEDNEEFTLKKDQYNDKVAELFRPYVR